MNALRHDQGYGFRMIATRPAATIIVILTLFVGIGGNIALLSIVNSVLLRGLSFRDAGRLVFIHDTQRDVPKFPASHPDYEDWRQLNTSFEDMAAYALQHHNKRVLITRGEAQEVVVALVTNNLSSMMGIQPRLGRAFLPEESRPGHDQVVILSERMWQQQFSADPEVLGQGIEIDGKSFLVIGVVGERDQFPKDADIRNF